MKRLFTALLLIPFAGWSALYSPYPVFLVVVCAIAALCFHEYRGIAAGFSLDISAPLGYAAGLVLVLTPRAELAACALVGAVALTVVMRADDQRRILPEAGALALGLLYIFGTWRCAVLLRQASPYWLLFALTINWAGDSAAFYIGRAFGRHRLAPGISPGKSWEGALASLAATMLYSFLYVQWLIPQFPVWEGVAVGALGNLAGQVGDLAESALKRGAGVKDSGSMLPGHGGWLDRLDSTLFSMPAIYVLIQRLWA